MNYTSLAKKIIPAVILEPIKNFKYDLQDYFNLISYMKGKSFESPPHIIKALRVIQTGKRHGVNVLVETGTFHGEMVRKSLQYFDNIFTIELDENLAQQASQRFQRYQKVRILHGDSGLILGSILEQIQEPAIFWLDGHYSGPGTAKGDLDTPILRELAIIKRHHIDVHIILIDDVRCFGADNYPTIDQVKSELKAINPSYRLSIIDDIISAEPF